MEKSAQSSKTSLLRVRLLTSMRLVEDFDFYDTESVDRLLRLSGHLATLAESLQEEADQDSRKTTEIKIDHSPGFSFELRHVHRGIQFLIAMGLEFPPDFFNLKVNCGNIQLLLLRYYHHHRLPKIRDTQRYQSENDPEMFKETFFRDGWINHPYVSLIRDIYAIHILEFCEDLKDIKEIAVTLDFAKYFRIDAIQKCASLALGCLVYMISPKDIEAKKKELQIEGDYDETDPAFKKALQLTQVVQD